ncbi:peptidoglycan-binding protein [Microcoleus sp. MOSTC5]|uniref:peptidoglycan-binding protein n=1 Tax=Microcoleus sp. MOSTC5 TaxID=3055378 RepID=UPI002FCE9B20
MNIVRLGDSDSQVEQLPNQLRHREFDVSSVDNQLGQKTQLAVEEFKKQKGLSYDVNPVVL